MSRGLYKDAVRVLLGEIGTLAEDQAGMHQLMLGESYYMQKQYSEARPWYLKAQRSIPENDPDNHTITEYRLACIAYRMNDTAGAFKLTDEFMRRHPTDRRSGSLLLFKMKAVAARGAAAEAELEQIRAHIAKHARRYGPATDVAADNVLTDFYLAQGGSEKARDRYRNIVMNFPRVTEEFISDHRSIPAGLERGHDKAAIQLASIALKDKDYDEAVRWLNVVRYDEEMLQRARLLLAQVAYERKDFRRAERYLLDRDYIETVPSGGLRSDMYLLLGFCAKRARHPRLEDVADYFSRVEPGSKAYFQAQMGLADTYERWRRWDDAIAAYENAKASAKYESLALASVARLYMTSAEKAPDAEKGDWLTKAAQRYQTLTTKYPNSREAKDATEDIEKLIAAGYDVKLAVSDVAVAKKWEATITQKPGSAEAARALINLARLHFKVVTDPKTSRVTRMPDYAACAHAADRLLNASVYTGKDLPGTTWRTMRAEALFYRGYSHMASATRSVPPGKSTGAPVYVAGASLDRANKDLLQARDTVDPQQIDLVKNIELGLLETMFKSNKDQVRAAAREQFDKLSATYGGESRFQKLAYDLAKWFQDSGQYADAAREYRGIADRSQGIGPGDVMRLLYLAGQLYSKAAYDAAEAGDPDSKRYAILVSPKHVFTVAGLLDTHKPFEKRVRLKGPSGSPTLSGEQALRLLSRASRIPFVWSNAGGNDSVGAYLKRKQVSFEQTSGTAKSFLAQILDSEHHELAFDIGLTGAAPTVQARPQDLEDPEMIDVVRVIEIIDRRYAALRFGPLARNYGTWSAAHPGNTMLFHVMQRIEKTSGTTVLWANGLDKEDILAAEFSAAPGIPAGQNATSAAVLEALLDPLDLRFSVVRRDLWSELYDQAKDAFNEVRRISPKSRYGEKSLFTMSLNFFHQKDYERMKIVLTEYLKIFDNASFKHYHEACFWVGWVFEHERRYRDACRYYNRAAEEKLVIGWPDPGEPPVAREFRKQLLAYDTAYALEETYSGALTDIALSDGLVDFVQLHSGVSVTIDPGVLTSNLAFSTASYQDTFIFDILNDVLDDLGLTFHARNVNTRISERAYFRMARSYQKDGRPHEALASCRVLLDRYPASTRRQDAYKLQLEIYKSLKDYRNVLATLQLLRKELEAAGQAYKVDFEIAWVYFDLCRYDDAIAHFKKALAGAQAPREERNIRDGYARALYMKGDARQALAEYRTLLAQENVALRAFVDEMMIWYLERKTGATKSDDLTPGASSLMTAYEALDAAQRSRIKRSALARVTWVYFTTGMRALDQGDAFNALDRLNAAGNSPDDWLAANSMYQVALIHMDAQRYRDAAEALEYLLFSTKAAGAEVRAAYSLGECYEKLGKPDRARDRYRQILDRFPDSPYAEQARKALAGLAQRSEPETPSS